jgi:hypothetical protein
MGPMEEVQILNLAGGTVVRLVFPLQRTGYKEVFINLSRIIGCWKIHHIIQPGKLLTIIARDMWHNIYVGIYCNCYFYKNSNPK